MRDLLKNNRGIHFHAKRHFVIILSVIVIAGYTIDLLVLQNESFSFIANLICIGITIISVLLTYLRVMSTKLSFAIILYFLLINIFISFYYNYNLKGPIEAETLRSCLIICMLLPLAGLVIEKKHALYIGAILIVYFIIVIKISHNNYLKDNFYLLAIVTTGYSSGIYYLLYLFENIMANQVTLISQLEEKNYELEEANQLLSEKNSLIEKQQEELKNTYETRDKIYSVISHDIKNPLYSVLGFTNLIQEKIKESEFNKVSIYANMISISVNNLYRLILNLLDWTRFHGSKLKPLMQVFDVNSNINDTLGLFENLLYQKNLELVVNLQNGIQLNADINMFNTIIRNFISNAIKYTPNGGNIQIETKTDGQNFLLIVSDTGVGIKQEVIDLLLNSNYNISTVGTKDESGTGLGLVLCKEFIHVHNGKLEISSVPGAGSKFSVSIPVSEPK